MTFKWLPKPTPHPTNNEIETRRIAAPAWLFSFVGAIIVFALLVTLNIITNKLPGKIDLTEDKLHTLSDGTLQILDGLDAEVKISFFVSKDKDNMPPELTIYAKRVDALLDEYARARQRMSSLRLSACGSATGNRG